MSDSNGICGYPQKFPHTCPVCNGYGTVSKPPWVAGDQATWVSTSVDPYPCPACGGAGVLWEEAVRHE